MDSLRGNKIFAAILIALMVSLVTTLLSEMMLSPKPLAKNVYVVDLPDEDADVTAVSAEEDKIEPVTALLANADVAAGEKVAKKCMQCHTFEKGGVNKIGPGLWNIVGHKKASHEDYAYSEAAKKQEGTWTYENLNAFLYKPRQYMPGTKMSFVGLKKVKDRANLIAYLRTLSGSPQPL